MKNVLSYKPLQFLVALIIGILLEFYFGLVVKYYLYFILFFILLFFFFNVGKNIVKPILVLFMFLFVGMFLMFNTLEKNNQHFFENLLKKDETIFNIKISKRLKSNTYNDRFIANVIAVNNTSAIGKVLLHIQKDSTAFLLDDEISTKKQPMLIASPLNPYQFSMQNWLEKQGVYHQLYLQKNDFIKISNPPKTIKGVAEKSRIYILESLQKQQFSTTTLGMINALILGDRQLLTEDVIRNYTDAGAIHILAISGLHIGIILIILNFLLQPFEFLSYGKFIKLILILLFLWLFALVAGFSASIVRAVTMFSFFAFGLAINKPRVMYFSIISSMFLLLLFKPLYLFDVGFQLSYLAVFGIVWLQPKLKKSLLIKNKILCFFWDIFTVSIAAQIFILPISLYYFNQFPSLFWLTNLVVIPCLGFILGTSILVIFCSFFIQIPTFFKLIFEWIFNLMNSYIGWIANHDSFLLKNLYINLNQSILLYCVFGFLVLYIVYKQYSFLLIALLSVIILQTAFLYDVQINQQKSELIVFNQSKKSAIALKLGSRLHIPKEQENNSYIRLYQNHQNVKVQFSQKMNRIITVKNQQFLIVDSLGLYQLQQLKNPVVVISNSPRINLERLIVTLQPKQIVVDGSNYKSYVKNWEEKALKLKVPFYNTAKNGAFRYTIE